nr:ATP-binding protein [Oculatella sp. LEGE 06141]
MEVGQRFLAETSSSLATSLDYQTTLTSVVESVVPFLADYDFLDVVTADNQMQRVAWKHTDPQKQALFEQLYFIHPQDIERPDGGQVWLNGEALFVPYVSDEWMQAIATSAEHLQRMKDCELCSLIAVPLLARNRTLGVLTFCFTADSGRHYTAHDLALAEELAHRAALALDNAKLYQQAQDANRVKDEFLAVLSHELRSPLNPIMGWAKLLRSRPFDQQTTAHALEIIERNAKLQTELIEDLLDVSRILQGKLSLNVYPVDLSSTVAAAIETVRLSAEAKAIDFRVELAAPAATATSDPQQPTGSKPSTCQVLGDPNRLQQIVWNLLSNAVKFTPSGGHVDIRLEAIGTQAQITVSDTGKGIGSDFLPHVFDYFRQADGATTRQFGGLGLGLAIVHHLVELHGGTVRAESAGENQGATFIVQLPLMAAQVLQHQAAEGSTQALTLADVTVLVVDDEADMREFMAFVLEQYGANVITAASAVEALERLAQTQPDILLSDIGMPDVDGYMLIRQVRSLTVESSRNIPAIALTAYAGEMDQQQALASGFQLHLSKPVEAETVAKAIVQLISPAQLKNLPGER